MSLLTTEEYQSIAANLSLPENAFIDGGYRSAISGRTFPSLNPATGEKIADIAACNSDDVDFAVAKARDSFEDGRWSKLPPSTRKDALIIVLSSIWIDLSDDEDESVA